MWARDSKASGEARQFAAAFGLGFHSEGGPELPPAAGAHPFDGGQRKLCVSGEWRGRPVQRFAVGEHSVELMTLPVTLARLQVIPAGLDRGALSIGGGVVRTGDPTFDSRFSVYTSDPAFAGAVLDDAVREALLHPAACGRALTVDGNSAYLWAREAIVWSQAKTHLEFLSVVVARIEQAMRARDVASADEETPVWMPAEEEREFGAWEFAPIPELEPVRGHGARGDFVNALLGDELDGATFVPQDSVDGEFGSWRVAPLA